jgi:hypothetical protein
VSLFASNPCTQHLELTAFTAEQPLYNRYQWFRGGLVFKAHRLVYHSILGISDFFKDLSESNNEEEETANYAEGHASPCTTPELSSVVLQGYLAHQGPPTLGTQF